MNSVSLRNLICTIVSYAVTIAIAMSVSSCVWQPGAKLAKHESGSSQKTEEATDSDYFIVFLVASRNLNYIDNKALFDTVQNIDNPKKGGRAVGHSWVYIHGIRDGREFSLEGGHSALLKGGPGYVSGVINLNKYGHANPKGLPENSAQYEPNPIKYLWVVMKDGFFQKGAGGHSPTFAARVNITKNEFEQVLAFMDKDNYMYKDFSIIDRQCTTFVARLAALVGLELEHTVTVQVDSEINVGNQKYRLWTDPLYSKITFASPDKMESSLRRAVADGQATSALSWYARGSFSR